MKPKIGVMPLYIKDSGVLWMNPGYLNGLLQSGSVPAVLPLGKGEDLWEDLCLSFDGFLFTGGQDIDPALYNEEKLPQCDYQAELRDAQEIWMLKRLFDLDKPVLGICRGAQIINVARGGSLYQDIPSQMESAVNHKQEDKDTFHMPVHPVRLSRNWPERFGDEHLMVNSIHHQGVRKLGSGLVAAAQSPDGLVEGLYDPDARFIMGVQWHPEFLLETDPGALRIFTMLTDASRPR